ncbi:MAG: autotransporter domain-containing protein [Siculibacillus sp.]|nr:autotransporter domain-containing protein [Siculibacillus sp.]
MSRVGRVHSRVATAYGLGVALAVLPSVASAQQVTLPLGGRFVTIGDSLSDNGNLFGTTGNPPAPYFNGRFSNGQVWTELIAGPMNQPFLGGALTGNVNLAFGGARSDNAVNLNGPIPSLQTQLGTYMFLGGTFAAADTVTLLGGANNIFQYFTVAGGGATPAGITATSLAAATDMAGITQAVATAGAGRILISNLPDLGVTPSYNGSPATAGAGSLATATFNQSLATQVQALALANPNTNIVQMDLAAALDVIRGNSAAFGFTNVTSSCIATLACVTGTAATQNGYLFWDGVHPTARGHQLIALYAGLLLAPEASAADVAAVGDVAMRGRLAAADDVLDRAGGWAEGQYLRQNGLWATATGSRGIMGARGPVGAYDHTIGGMRFGLDRAVSPNLLLGASLGFGAGRMGGVMSSNITSFDGDVYANYTADAFFVSGALGASWMGFDDLERATGMGPLVASGSTSARQWSASVETGFMARTGGVTLAPSARLQYVHADIGGYQETSPILAMAFADRSAQAVLGGVRLRASMMADLFGAKDRAFGEIGYERALHETHDGVIARFVGNTAQPFTGNPDGFVGRGLNFKIGYDATINDKVSMTLSYGAALNDGAGTSHTGQIRVKMPF